jgi:hypothetical protein
MTLQSFEDGIAHSVVLRIRLVYDGTEDTEFQRIALPMDKKTKKKLQNLNQRLQALRQQLAGAKKQADDPSELEAFNTRIAEVEAEIAKLKAS